MNLSLIISIILIPIAIFIGIIISKKIDKKEDKKLLENAIEIIEGKRDNIFDYEGQKYKVNRFKLPDDSGKDKIIKFEHNFKW